MPDFAPARLTNPVGDSPLLNMVFLRRNYRDRQDLWLFGTVGIFGRFVKVAYSC